MTAEQLALFVAGLIAPFLTQLLKKWFGDLEAKPALWVSFGASAALAAVALFLTGGFKIACDLGNPLTCITGIVEAIGVVFGLATVIYKFFMSKPE